MKVRSKARKKNKSITEIISLGKSKSQSKFQTKSKAKLTATPKIMTQEKRRSKPNSKKSSLSPVSKRINSSLKTKRNVCREIQKSVDNALLSLPPKVQSNIDQALKSLERSAFRLQDLRTIGYRVLQHATEISKAMKESAPISKLKKRAKS